jgi:putative transcriptional regulator
MTLDPSEQPVVRSSLQGSLLIAMPLLRDPNFHRMVTLIVSHDENGAFGVVLGPPTDLPAARLGEPFSMAWERADLEFVRYGGPCERARIWLFHGGDKPLEDAVTIAPGIHLGSSQNLLRDINENSAVPAMIFSGYAGWAPGQLERELQEKSWLPGELAPELVFSTPPDDVWEHALKLSSLSPTHIGSGQGASS